MAKLTRFKGNQLRRGTITQREIGAFYIQPAIPTEETMDGVVQLTEFLQWVADRLAYQQSTGEVGEAPINGKLYGRKNGTWVEVPIIEDGVIINCKQQTQQ